MERRGGKGKGANGGECEGTEGEERKGRLSLSVLLAPGSYGRLTDAAVAVRRTKRHRKYYIKATPTAQDGGRSGVTRERFFPVHYGVYSRRVADTVT